MAIKKVKCAIILARIASNNKKNIFYSAIDVTIE